MKSHFCIPVMLVFLAACSSSGGERVAESNNEVPPQITQGVRHTYVLVHGASGGGWDWRTIDNLLSADGHDVYRPTLAGLGEKVHLSNPDIDLTTHINDIANVILFEDLQDVVLVGHSYGGMVITGVLNLIPQRIKHAIFLDAAVPNDGMSAEDTFPPESMQRSNVEDGIVYFPWLDGNAPLPRDVPQSLKTFTEPVSFDNPAARKVPATFIAFISPEVSIEDRRAGLSWQHAEARGWTVITLNSDHNAQRSHPQELTALLEESVKSSN